MILCHLNVIYIGVPLQGIENLLRAKVHESMIDTAPCTEHNSASVIHHDAETQCETTNLFDAETQCKKGLERSIAIQTLAPRKKNTKK